MSTSSEALQHWFVYIVRCSDNTLYTGCTNNVEQRIATHNSGKGAKYTKSRLPVIEVYREICDSKSSALKREYEIKQLTRVQKLALIKQA